MAGGQKKKRWPQRVWCCYHPGGGISSLGDVTKGQFLSVLAHTLLKAGQVKVKNGLLSFLGRLTDRLQTHIIDKNASMVNFA